MSTWRSAGLGLVCGLMFAAGLVLAGMTNPGRVLGFLDFAGDWDPRLAFVMLGAIGVHFTWLRLATRLQGPSARAGSLAPHGPITRPLIAGATLFGIGWGMAGYCPGPAVVNLGLGGREGSVFLGAMLAGMLLFQLLAGRSRAAVDSNEACAAE